MYRVRITKFIYILLEIHYNTNIVTDDPGLNLDHRYARRRDRQNYIRKIKYKFRTSREKELQVGTI